jgi:hypothetical protein
MSAGRSPSGPAGVKTPIRFAKVENSLAGRRRCEQKCFGHTFRSRRTTGIFSTVRGCMQFHSERLTGAKEGGQSRQPSMRSLFDPATLITFEIGRIARPYNIEILYGPFFGGHLERWLRARKLYLLTCVQTRDHLGRGCGVSIHNQPSIYDAGTLKHPRHTSLGHATSPLGYLFGRHTKAINELCRRRKSILYPEIQRRGRAVAPNIRCVANTKNLSADSGVMLYESSLTPRCRAQTFIENGAHVCALCK